MIMDSGSESENSQDNNNVFTQKPREGDQPVANQDSSEELLSDGEPGGVEDPFKVNLVGKND
jgi:hypothetical protein